MIEASANKLNYLNTDQLVKSFLTSERFDQRMGYLVVDGRFAYRLRKGFYSKKRHKL